MAINLSEEINTDEWIFFLTSEISLDNPLKNPISWLQDESWDELCRLNNLPKFKVKNVVVYKCILMYLNVFNIH